MRVCSCQQAEYDKELALYMSIAEKKRAEMIAGGKHPEEAEQMMFSFRLNAPNKAHNAVAERMRKAGVKCPVERELIRSTIDAFKSKDMSKPEVFMIVKSVINHQLSAHRMQLYSSNYGILQELSDRDGNTFYKINPVESAKRKFDDSIIKAMDILNNITEGRKVAIKGMHAVVSPEELFGRYDPSETEEEVRDI